MILPSKTTVSGAKMNTAARAFYEREFDLPWPPEDSAEAALYRECTSLTIHASGLPAALAEARRWLVAAHQKTTETQVSNACFNGIQAIDAALAAIGGAE